MSDARTRVKHLIALALNPGANPNEARNAALQACRLISENKLLDERPEGHVFLGMPFEAEQEAVQTWGAAYEAGGVSFDQVFEELFGKAAEARRRANAQAPRPARPPPQHRAADESAAVREMVTNVPGWCTGCGLRYTDGQVIVVARDKNWKDTYWHRPCWNGRK